MSTPFRWAGAGKISFGFLQLQAAVLGQLPYCSPSLTFPCLSYLSPAPSLTFHLALIMPSFYTLVLCRAQSASSSAACLSLSVCAQHKCCQLFTHTDAHTHLAHTPSTHTDNCLGVCTMSRREQRTAPYHKISHRLQLQRGRRRRRCRQQQHRKRAQKGVACTKCERTRFMPH